jgi:CheY-like chemotaxis protein
MNKPKVLVADDDNGLLKALQVRLEHVGFEVTTAVDGYRALVEAREDLPDVLVLDINMPAGNGFTVQDRLEKLQATENKPSKRIPVIYITGDKSDGVKGLAKNLGAFALIYKPFDVDNLCETIMQAMAPPPCAA